MAERFNKGVVAVLDALGFKGIWKREDPQAVIARLQSAQRIEGGFVGHGELDLQIRFLSDTVVVACGFGEQQPSEVLLFVCMRVSYFLSDMLGLYGPRLAYRGAVASGDYLIEDNFIIGPAVDEAAEGEKQPQGPFVWLTPTARQLLPADVEDRRLRATPMSDSAFYVMPLSVPLKGRAEETYIVLPTAYRSVGEIATALRQVVMGAPQDKVDNTEALINALERDDRGES
jgi:hypothetical protein